jgi:type IX secretion system PorP/SprF family membrane protein
MKKIVQVLVLVGLTFSGAAQELNSHYLYEMNWLNVNPAYTGETEGIKAILNPGTQWVGIDGNPSNVMFGLHSKMNKNMGFGGKMVMDKRGVFSNFTGELNYKYKATIAKDHFLSFGITAGIYRTYLNVNTILDDQYTDNTDPVVTSQYYDQTHFLSSFGVLYQFKGLEVGASSPHLVVSGKPVSDHLFGMARYSFDVESVKLKITHSVVYQNLTNSPNQIDGGLKVMWDNTIWGKFTYKTNHTMIAAVGVNIEKVNVGYAYVINQGAMSTISSGSHEILIAFTFDKRTQNSNPKIEGLSSTAGSSRLSLVLADLKSINNQPNGSPEVKKEIAEIQVELSRLVAKGKNGKHENEDEKAMNKLEKRISKLKTQIR